MLALLGGPDGGAESVKFARGSCNILALFFGFTTSIGRSYGDWYPPLDLPTKL